MAEPSSAARAWLDAAPASDRVRLERLHALVLDVADEVGAAPVIEETKWGQPSFRASNGKESTPVRLAWDDDEISKQRSA